MTYHEAMEFIRETGRFGSVLGLESMRTLLEGLNNPQDKLKFVHVAGTNGKGSVAAYISTIIASAGYRVGRYISPAVFEYKEIIQITAGKPGEEENLPAATEYISEASIAACIGRIKPVCLNMVEAGMNHPTVFEIETAMAILYFLEQDCDVAVLEAGLGGKLDATNVIETVLCSVITSISMDHMKILGDTLEQIAEQKAGIIKEGVSVVSYEQAAEAEKVIKAVCAEKNARLVTAEFNKIRIEKQDIDGTLFYYDNQGPYQIRMLGENQVKNAVLAILAVEILKEQGFTVSDGALIKGLFHTRWKGRFDIIGRTPLFLADGAHNEDAARVLARNIEIYFKGKRIIYILGVLADKDFEAELRHTGAYADLIITITPKNSRGLSSYELAKTARNYCRQVIDAKEVPEAVDLAIKEAGEEDVIIAFGSLSYLGEVYRYTGHTR